MNYIGKIVGGKYKIYDKVGSGGMATVYLARNLNTNEIVAIKILHSEYAENENFVKRFLKEAEIAVKMKHENIAQVLDFGKDEDTYFIAMEYVQGKTLSKILEEKGRLPYEEVVRIASEVAKALSYAHSKGLIAHRDIKPQNIMLTANGKVKVMDFGIAKLVGGEGLTATDSILGTPFYMSPEQAKGQSVDIRSDLYALGITMYQMLTGKVPFDGETPWSVISSHLTKEVPPINLEDVPEKLKKIILKLLEKDPQKRYHNPEELLNDLSEISESKTIPQEISEIEKGKTVILKNEEISQVKDNKVDETVVLTEQKTHLDKITEEVKTAKEKEHEETVILSKEETTEAKKGETQIIEDIEKTKKKSFEKSPQLNVPKINVQEILHSKVMISIIAIILIVTIGTVVFASTKYRNSLSLQGNGISQTSQISIGGGSTISSGTGTGNGNTQTGGSGVIVKKEIVINVDSIPQGAEIFINGKDTGLKTPNKVKLTEEGTYEVTVKMDGYENATKTVNLKNGETISLNFELKPLLGNINVNSNPNGAEIFIDGKDTGLQTPNTIKNVSAGTHTITLKKTGYKSASVNLEVKAGETVSITLNLEKEASTLYTLKVNSTPQGAEIFINGKDTGFKTPHDFTLSPGEYKVELKKDGYETYVEQISLTSNKIISATLKKKTSVKSFKNNLYSFNYPTDWTLEENPDEVTDIRIDSPKFEDGHSASVFVYRIDLEKEGIDEKEYFEYLKTQALENEVVLEEKNVEINGKNFYKLVISGKGEDIEGNPIQIKDAIFFLKRGSILYCIEFNGTPNDFDKAWSGFLTILYSFNIR